MSLKPKIPCSKSCKDCVKEDGSIKACEKYLEFRKAISKYWDEHPEEFYKPEDKGITW